MRNLFLVSLFFFCQLVFSQKESLISGSAMAQQKLNEEFTNPETTILDADVFKDFKGLEFYPLNPRFIVEADFIRTPGEKPFLMPTTTARLPEYIKYGEAHFKIDGKNFVLNLYRSTQPYSQPGYEDYLFLPFTDYTSGDGSYGGGRYLDQRIPERDMIIID